ncbi:hypothetical protein [Promicromonospora soli]
MLEIERSFVDEWLDFVVALRMNEGLDSNKYELLKNSLQSCAESWRTETAIDRVVAGVLVEIFPAMESCADAYEGEERSRIGRAAYELQDLIIQGLAAS